MCKMNYVRAAATSRDAKRQANRQQLSPTGHRHRLALLQPAFASSLVALGLILFAVPAANLRRYARPSAPLQRGHRPPLIPPLRALR